MRLHQGVDMPCCDTDLQDEFADTYDLQTVRSATGTEWTARLIGVPGALVHAADSPGELARELRMMQ